MVLLTGLSAASLSFAGWNHPCFHCSVLLCSFSSKLLEALEEITSAQLKCHRSNRTILAQAFGEISLFLFSDNLWFSTMSRGTAIHSEVIAQLELRF